MDSEGFRHATITTNDHGGLIQIVAWYLMIVMILATVLKLAIRFKPPLKRNPGIDDAVYVVAMVSSYRNLPTIIAYLLMKRILQLFGIGVTIAMSLAVNNGLGQSAAIRNPSQASSLQKVCML